MKIKAEDTAALIIDFQEKLVPAIADHDEIVAKAAIFAAGLKEFGVPMAVTQQYTKGLGETASCDEGKPSAHLNPWKKQFFPQWAVMPLWNG